MRITHRLLGPQVFLTWDAPGYKIAWSVHLGCYSLLVLALIGLRFYLKRQNQIRDQMASAGVQEANDERMVHAFEDLTDKENPNFRYVY
jgi:hypothetical protein